MDLKHFVATTRPIGIVKVNGQPDQFWLESAENNYADVSSNYFRCGRYVESNGTVDKPFFYNPQTEDEDYIGGANAPTEEQLTSKGSSEEMLNILFSELEKEKKDLLVYLFGYQNPLCKEMNHVELLHKAYVASGNCNVGRILMLTWPSQGFGGYSKESGTRGFFGNLFRKKEPEKTSTAIDNDVHITGNALAVFLLKLKNFIAARKTKNPTAFVPKINFVVQSMANSVLEKTYAKLIEWKKENELSNLFHRLMYTSSDVRNDIFEISPAFYASASIAEKAYIVYSSADWILKLSDTFHKIPGTKRLGFAGPKDLSKIPDNISLLEIVQRDIRARPVDYNHRYFQYNSKVYNQYAKIFSGENTERKVTVVG